MHVIKRMARRMGLYEGIAFVTGFVLMAYELVASRIMAPSIGTSTYVWTSVIGVMIAALAIGYAVGGWVADQRTNKSDLSWLLLAAALAVVCSCLFYERTLQSIVSLLHDPRLQGVVAATILFVPASFILGMISPYLARLRVHSVTTTGRSVAGLSALNSVGGITGTFCTGFIFFSIIGSQETLALLAGVLIACSWLIMPGYRLRQRLATSVVLLAAITVQLAAPAAAAVVADIDTPTSHYKIMDIPYQNRQLRALITGPEGIQSGAYLDNPSTLAFDYTRKIAEAVAAAPHHDRILILGGGAYTLPAYLGQHYPAAHITVVEIDPQLPKIATTYFSYQPPTNVQNVAQDARTFLRSAAEQYDIIIVDVYNDAAIPFALTTTEYTARLRAAGTSDAVVIANLIGADSPACRPLMASLQTSYQQAFTHTRLFPLEPEQPQRVQNIIGLYSNASLAWAGSMSGAQPLTFSDGYHLSDNYAPIEALRQRCR